MNDTSMIELSDYAILSVSGGDIDWGAVGAGAAFIGLSFAVAATPVGWVGAGFAAASAFGGGFSVGTGFFADQF